MATAFAEEKVRGVDKVARYKWKTNNAPGEFAMIDKNLLDVGAEYQRQADSPKVLRIAREFNWISCSAIAVARRSGVYRVMDGQHRVLGARKRSDIKQLPCLVFDTGTVAEEARGFIALNVNRKAVSAVDKHRASVIAEDPLALKIQETLDDLGLTLSRSARVVGTFGAIAWANRRAAEDYHSFRRVMAFTSDLCRASDLPVAEKLLSGLDYLDRNVLDGLENKRFAARIQHVGAEPLIDAATRAAAYFARGGAKVFAQGMIDALNKGIHTKFELIP